MQTPEEIREKALRMAIDYCSRTRVMPHSMTGYPGHELDVIGTALRFEAYLRGTNITTIGGVNVHSGAQSNYQPLGADSPHY